MPPRPIDPHDKALLGHSSPGSLGGAEPPPSGRITLDDIDAYALILEAACPSCKGPRRIPTTETLPGWGPPQRPLAELFADGKLQCRLHGRPASRMIISRRGPGVGIPTPIGEWVVS